MGSTKTGFVKSWTLRVCTFATAGPTGTPAAVTCCTVHVRSMTYSPHVLLDGCGTESAKVLNEEWVEQHRTPVPHT